MEALGYDFLEAPDHVLGVNVAPAGRLGSRAQHLGAICSTIRSCCSASWPAARAEARFLDRRADPAAAADRAGGEAGGVPGCAVRGPLPPGHRRRLERGGVRRPEREFPQSRPALGRAGAGDAGAVGGSTTSSSRAGTTRSRMPGSIRARHRAACRCGIGGHHEKTLPRIAKWGDGWMPNAYPPDQTALDIFGELRRMTEAEGRDPAAVGIEVWTSCGAGSAADWRKEAAFWKAAGATHLCLTTTFNRRHHHRIAGRSLADHLDALRRYREAIAERTCEAMRPGRGAGRRRRGRAPQSRAPTGSPAPAPVRTRRRGCWCPARRCRAR